MNRPIFRGIFVCLLRRLLCGLLLCAFCTGSFADTSTETVLLIVKITGLRNHNGNLAVAVYEKPETFLHEAKSEQTQTVKLADFEVGKPIFLTFKGKPGICAISVLHDENANGKMDTGLFGIPKEGWGVSNNVRPKFRAPRWNDAKFERRSPETVVEIKVRY